MCYRTARGYTTNGSSCHKEMSIAHNTHMGASFYGGGPFLLGQFIWMTGLGLVLAWQLNMFCGLTVLIKLNLAISLEEGRHLLV